MLFPTFSFAVFFLCVFIGFWYVFRRNLDRRLFLVAASYLFYAFWDWRLCGILFLSTAANYGFEMLVGMNRDHPRRKLVLVLSVLFNLLLLGFFKYYNFFAETANGLIGRFAGGSPASSPLFPALSVLLPVGISFYTFKAMSLVFDVYLCKLPPVRSFLDVMLYVSFFPQVASGPIVHACDFFPQIRPAVEAGIDPDSKPIEFNRASLLVMSGLLKKMVFANFLSTLLVSPVFSAPSSYGPPAVLLAAVAYSVVIYCDFSGYSDMAIGIALLLGFQTPENFHRPYLSFSVTEFWKRWHITFSSWLRNYLYFSLGGSRFGLARTLFALFFTMILGGLWHGASLTFIVWGAMQGLALALERGFNYGNRRSPRPLIGALQILGTFAFTTASWIVFRSSSLGDVFQFVKALFAGAAGPAVQSAPSPLSPLVIVLVCLGLGMHAVPERIRSRTFTVYGVLPLPVKAFCFAAFFGFLAVVSMSGIAPFIYFQF
jgi:Predicted membrane protein involved in D-alanine export